MIDHLGVTVSDFGKSKAFYAQALSSIGYTLLMELPASVTGHTDTAGFGEAPKPNFWISRGVPNQPPIHIAFRAATRARQRAAGHPGALPPALLRRLCARP